MGRSVEMTLQQAQELDLLKRTVLQSWSHGYPWEHEIKQWDVTVTDCAAGLEDLIAPRPLVFVRCILGHKGDEGTALEVMGRESRLYRIGRRGGVQLLSRGRG